MKKISLLLILTATLSQAQTKCKQGLIYSSANIKTGKYEELDVKKIHYAFWSDSIVINTKKEKRILGPERIWGYRDNECKIYRNYESDFYEVDQADSLVIYTQTINPFRDFAYTFYYFSKTLDSPIYKLTRKNLEKEFQNNSCFLSGIDKQIKWYEDYSTIDRKKHIYKIVEIYRDCQKK